jgi:hypothetical protein
LGTFLRERNVLSQNVPRPTPGTSRDKRGHVSKCPCPDKNRRAKLENVQMSDNVIDATEQFKRRADEAHKRKIPEPELSEQFEAASLTPDNRHSRS